MNLAHTLCTLFGKQTTCAREVSVILMLSKMGFENASIQFESMKEFEEPGEGERGGVEFARVFPCTETLPGNDRKRRSD